MTVNIGALALIFLTWQHVTAVNMTGCLYHEPHPLIFDAVRDPTGDIYSPGFQEGQYPDELYCAYVIKAKADSVIKLAFLEMDVEPFSRCGRDRIYIHDGTGEDAPNLGAYCGLKPPPFPIVSTQNAMYLRFSTNDMITRRGFHARYEAVRPSEVCPPGQLRCKNNRCFRPEQKCDGVDNCLDGSDEENCNRPVPSYKCGISSIFPIEQSSRGADKIVGGIEARPHSWPWQADMQISLFYPNSHHCGGTLIHPQWVMTAAHCLSGNPYATDWRVHLGNHNRFRKDRYEQIRLVELIVLYPGYTGKDIIGKFVDMDNDLALMKLNAPVDITEGVRPACLPPQGYDLPVGTKCTATGWGETRGTGSYENLKQAEMVVQSQQKCPRGDPKFRICLASVKGGVNQGVCHGDSGGPLACKIDDKYHVLGVASFVTGTNLTSGLCAVGGTMSVYNRVSNKVDWIRDMIRQFS